MYFNSLRSNARGVAILVKESCPITNVSAQIIVPGKLTQLTFTYKEENWTIAALYAPNNKDLQFFHTLFEAENDPNTDQKLYAGDWYISVTTNGHPWIPTQKQHTKQRSSKTENYRI